MDERFGLITTLMETVPFCGLSVTGQIVGRGARVKVSQRFRNTEHAAVEAVASLRHPIRVATQADRIDVSFTGGEARMDRDLVPTIPAPRWYPHGRTVIPYRCEDTDHETARRAGKLG